jgi:tRNA nucleotidyltransferase (CCA-adding enzyme)
VERSAAPAIPAEVSQIMATLWAAGHGAWVVGGSLRDALLGRPAADWDLATDARPDRLLEVFPGSVYENAFGTVAVRHAGTIYEITTFRTDHDYADFRRPHRVEFGDTIEADLGRRDFTVNAMAWGAPPPADEGTHPEPFVADPFNGRRDVEGRILRAVGDPLRRFEEDALRMIRAVRLAATLGFTIEPATRAGIETRAGLVRHLSGERVAMELGKLLAAPRPSVGLRLMEETGILRHVAPELADQRGVAQNKMPGEDLWDHTLRSVDAAPAERPVVRLAALLHDIGKPATAGDGHFRGHEKVGAEMARAFLDRLRAPRAVTDRVVHLVHHHMFSYDPAAGDAAIRRMIRRVGATEVDELLMLREADNIGSGQPPDHGRIAELRARIEAQLAAHVPLDRAGLAIGGSELIDGLGLQPGPMIGRILDELLERVIADPVLNDRPTLLLLAQSLVEEPG